MAESQHEISRQAVDRAISHAELALSQCDNNGFIYAAIDLSSAIEKLVAIRDQIQAG